jgi:hypothetical protein
MRLGALQEMERLRYAVATAARPSQSMQGPQLFWARPLLPDVQAIVHSTRSGSALHRMAAAARSRLTAPHLIQSAIFPLRASIDCRSSNSGFHLMPHVLITP